jgi:hypothetical protein
LHEQTDARHKNTHSLARSLTRSLPPALFDSLSRSHTRSPRPRPPSLPPSLSMSQLPPHTNVNVLIQRRVPFKELSSCTHSHPSARPHGMRSNPSKHVTPKRDRQRERGRASARATQGLSSSTRTPFWPLASVGLMCAGTYEGLSCSRGMLARSLPSLPPFLPHFPTSPLRARALSPPPSLSAPSSISDLSAAAIALSFRPSYSWQPLPLAPALRATR